MFGLPDEWDSRLTHSYQEILAPEETERYARFVFEKDRRQFLLTRALVRDVLSRYVGEQPSALVFTHNDFGKPALGGPPGHPVSFNLAHTKGMSVCAVVSKQMIGVDVENLQRINGTRISQEGSSQLPKWHFWIVSGVSKNVLNFFGCGH